MFMASSRPSLRHARGQGCADSVNLSARGLPRLCFRSKKEDVEGRDKPGQDDAVSAVLFGRHIHAPEGRFKPEKLTAFGLRMASCTGAELRIAVCSLSPFLRGEA